MLLTECIHLFLIWMNICSRAGSWKRLLRRWKPTIYSTIMLKNIALGFVLTFCVKVSAFGPSIDVTKTAPQSAFSTNQLFQGSDDVAETETVSKTDMLTMPLSYSEMVKQVASAMREAYDQKMDRQIVRVLLPRDRSSTQLGVLSEGILDVDSQDIVLVPPDESWQGGIMQLYRSAAPTCTDVLRYVKRKKRKKCNVIHTKIF